MAVENHPFHFQLVNRLYINTFDAFIGGIIQDQEPLKNILKPHLHLLEWFQDTICLGNS